MIQNAIITSVSLTIADHGCLSAWIQLDYGGSGQGFGGFSLYLPKSFKNHGGPNVAGHFIFRCIEVAGVEKWEDIVGKTVRVDCEHNKVKAIGHIVKNDWFCPESDFEEMLKKV